MADLDEILLNIQTDIDPPHSKQTSPLHYHHSETTSRAMLAAMQSVLYVLDDEGPDFLGDPMASKGAAWLNGAVRAALEAALAGVAS